MLKTLIRTTAIATLLVAGAAHAQDSSSEPMQTEPGVPESEAGSMESEPSAPESEAEAPENEAAPTPEDEQSDSESASDSAGTGSRIGEMPVVGGAPMDPQKPIGENATEAANLTTLVAAMKAADLVETLSGAGPFTVLAPSNEAFEKLPDGTVDELLKPENKERLTNILVYHVIPEEATSEALTKLIEEDGGEHPVTTLEGQELTLSKDGDTIVATDPQGNAARVTQADVMQSNGVVHVIDTVLMPAE
ncbi:fasciclin domain-containing protein [Fulvimarina sp. MAC8]|uniref:fasciclin domain-containing protein n=1 Tax=Fulvimarina sp. MAC8 TaxID=3162874 RepID=UPI0032EE5221